MLSPIIARIALIGTVLLLFAIASIVIFVIFHQKKYMKIQAEKKLAEKTYQLKLAEEVIRSQEEERKSIAEDLHDDLAPNLASAKLFLKAGAGKDLAKQEEIKNKVIGIIDDSINKIRHLSHLLHSVEFETYGFFKTLKRYSEKLNTTEEVHIHLDIQNEEIKLNAFFQLALFRIVQELINNAIKHAAAKVFHVEYISANDYIIINLTRDGHRFSSSDYQEAILNARGIGLMNIQNRIELLSSKIDFDYKAQDGKYGIQILIPNDQDIIFQS